MSRDMTQYQDILGSGGSKKARTPIEQEVTFSSKAVAYVAIAYSEGECGGLAEAARSIFIDQTPLMADDGSMNFPGVTFDERFGLPDQEAVPDFTWPGSLKEVNVQVTTVTPFIRTVSSNAVDKISIVIRTPALQETKENGDQIGSELAFKIEKYDPVAKLWVTEHERFAFKGRVVSNYEVEVPVTRAGPEPGPATPNLAPWQIRVTRLTPDSKTNRVFNESHISYVVERSKPVGDVARYNDTAFVALRVDTSLFGDRLPVVSFKVNGIKCKVPTNYDPKTGVYSNNGVWDGTFKVDVTSNPAWQIYDLLTNTRYGLGLPEAFVNKWELYSMARYCDGLVPDGLGGMRRRFTCRTQINDSEDAISLLNAMASAMRAAPYWGAGSVNIVQDAPKPVAKIASQVNVIDGNFSWRGTELSNRYTTCYVSWNDPNDFFRPRISKYQDDPAILKYGLNETSLAKFGCANEAEAIAFAKYVVDSSLAETQAVSFTGGLEFADARPGDIVEVSDPMRAKSRMSGRVKANGTVPNRLVLDAPVVLAPGETYTLVYVVGEDDNYIQTAPITNPAGTHSALTLAGNLPFEVDHPYLVVGSDIAPKKMRITSVKEDEGRYPIVAVEFDTTKFARTELGIFIEPPQTSRYTDKSVRPPSGIRFRDEIVVRDGVHFRILTMAWDPSASEFAVGYVIQWRRENLNFSTPYSTGIREFEIVNPQPGTYDFLVSSVSGLGGAESVPVQATYVVDRAVPVVIPTISGLRLKNAVDPNGTEFRVPDAEFTWNHASSAAGEFGSDPVKASLDATFVDYEIKIFSEDFTLLRVDSTVENWYQYSYSMNLDDRKRLGFTTPVRKFTIEVRQRGSGGQVSDTPARLTVGNPAPPVPLALLPEGFFRFYRVTHSPLEHDAVGILIWASKTSGFIPGPDTIVHEGVGTLHDVEAEPGTKYFLRVAAYDTFGRFDLNYSSELTVQTYSSEVSFADPKMPTGLTLSTTSEILADGSQRVRVHAVWDRPAADSEQVYWEIGITESGGSEIVFPVNWVPPTPADATKKPNYSFDARLNTVYSIRVRAVNVVTFSGWTAAKTVTSGRDSTIPPAPSGLKGAAAFKTVFLSWVNPAIDDLDYIEVWEGFTTTRAGGAGGVGKAEIVARVYTDSYTRSGLATGETRHYWVRAIDTSGNESPFYPDVTGIPVTTSKIVGGPDIEANSITTNSLSTAIIWADMIQTGSLDAAKIKANTILSDQIKVGPNTLATLSDWAGNPATRVNANTTLIDAGRIRIQGSNTLLNWKSLGDSTTINGGMIEANSIKSNSIQIGDRGVDLAIQFEHDNLNTVSWSGGTVSYLDTDGIWKTRSIEPGSATRTGSGLLYIGWSRWQPTRTGNMTMVLYSTQANPVTAMPSNDWVVVASYAGGSLLVVNYGKTLISGSDIKTGTVTAANIQALSITGDKIAGNTITGGKIVGESITGDRIAGGTITGNKIAGNTISGGHIIGGTITGGHIAGNTISGGHIQANTINAASLTSSDITSNLVTTTGSIQVWDANNNRHRAWIGHRPMIDYGFWIWAANGEEIIAPDGVNGFRIRNLTVGTLKIQDNAVTVPSVERMIPGDVNGRHASVSDGGPPDLSLDQLLRSDIVLNQPGTIVAWANLAQKYPSGTRSYRIELWVDGIFRAERHAGTGAYNDSPSIMIMVKNLGAGPHSVILKWGAQPGCYRSDAVLCVMGAMK